VQDGVKMVDMAPNLFSQDISNATYITYSSDLDVVGFQLNGSTEVHSYCEGCAGVSV